VSDEIRVDDLDELYASLVHELERLVSAAESVLGELDALDDLRASVAPNGHRLADARRVRREALSSRKQSIEFRRRARSTAQRSHQLGREFDAVAFRARALLDLNDPERPAPGPNGAADSRDRDRH
jgi:hypothetical protein